MKALILAGGFATRLWPITKERAKPLLLMNGKPLITHIVDKIPKNIEIYVTTNARFKKDFENWKSTLNREVKLIIEDTKSDKEKKGAIGSIGYFLEKNKIKDDLLVIAGDNFFHFKITDFIKNFKGFPLIAAHNIKRYELAKKFGVIKVEGTRVTSFEEKPDDPKSTLVSTGVYILPQELFSTLHYYLKSKNVKKDNLGSFIEYLVGETEVRGYVFPESWFDIGSFEGYLDAHKQQVKMKHTRGGEHFHGVDFVGNVTLKGSVFIDTGTFVKNSTIQDSIILGNCEIVNSKIKNSIIDVGASILDSKLNAEIVERDSRIKKFRD